MGTLDCHLIDDGVQAIDDLPHDPWYAVYTRHQHEKTVAQLLGSKGFEVFLPLYKSSRQWKDRTKHLILPLFPCYVFIHECGNRKIDLFSTPGVHSLVGAGGKPEPIPWTEIEAIRKTVEHGRVEPHPFLNCGDRVRVTAGPLEGLQGILVRKKNQFRVVVSIEVLQQSVAAEVDAHWLERVDRVRRPSGNLILGSNLSTG